ncbi:MAG TPA: protein kinase [Candidatus Polarisedimenticolia bacterium]|jgi:hypothetical protein
MDKREDEAFLLRVAEAISDGEPVDWESVATAHEGMRSKLARLKVLESLAGVHWTASRDAGPSGQPSRIPAPPEAPPAAPIDNAPLIERWGPLRIVEKVGQGGFGEVYRAFDPRLQTEVALKLRRAETAAPSPGVGTARFLEEARRLARVRHPNVLVVHGADEHDGRAGMWTDLVHGRTLEECIARQGRFSPEETAVIGIELCRALAAVHAAGLVHRDIKTSNVMRENGGRIILMDFSSVSEAAESPGGGGEEMSGTPLTMAPEILLDGEAPRPAADIYSLGVLLYRLVSGRYPVEARSLGDLYDAHRRGAVTPLRDARPDLPGPLVRVVERALSREPGMRYASAGQMERALAEAIGSPARSASHLPWIMAAAIRFGAVALLIAVPWRAGAPALSVDASLFRQGQGTQERLRSGGRVYPGDNLFLEMRGSSSLHVYVLNEDRRGEIFVLFPLPDGFDLRNPLPAQVLNHLPGRLAGVDQRWEVTSAGGRETILIVASRHPLPDLDREVARLPRAKPGHPVTYGQIEQRALDLIFRGVGGLTGTQPGPEGPGSTLSRIAGLLPDEREARGGIWVERIQLENPGP